MDIVSKENSIVTDISPTHVEIEQNEVKTSEEIITDYSSPVEEASYDYDVHNRLICCSPVSDSEAHLDDSIRKHKIPEAALQEFFNPKCVICKRKCAMNAWKGLDRKHPWYAWCVEKQSINKSSVPENKDCSSYCNNISMQNNVVLIDANTFTDNTTEHFSLFGDDERVVVRIPFKKLR